MLISTFQFVESTVHNGVWPIRSNSTSNRDNSVAFPNTVKQFKYEYSNYERN